MIFYGCKYRNFLSHADKNFEKIYVNFSDTLSHHYLPVGYIVPPKEFGNVNSSFATGLEAQNMDKSVTDSDFLIASTVSEPLS